MLKRLSFLPLLFAGFACADWPTYQGNNSHTGYVPSTANLANLQERWEKALDPQPTYSGIAIGGGRLFAANSVRFGLSRLYALDASTGELKWSNSFQEINSLNQPAYANGRVYFQTGKPISNGDAYFRCYDATTGLFVFRSIIGAQWESYLAPTIADGVAYLNAGYYGGMYAFSATDGSNGWFCDTLAQYDKWTPAVNATHCIAFIGERYYQSGDGGIYAINRNSGLVAYAIPDPDYNWNGWSMEQSVALDGNAAYVTNNGRLVKYNLTARNITWQTPRSFIGQVTVAPNALYLNDAGALTAIDKTNGDFLWQAESANGNLKGPLIATATHVIGQTQTHTVIFDVQTHQEVWSRPVTGPMALDGDVLYIAGQTITAYSIGGGPHTLQSLSLSKSTVAGANSVLAKVFMTTPAPADEAVTMWDNTQLIGTPAGVIVRRGQNTASVRLTTVPVAVTAVRQIYARFGDQTRVANLTLLPHGPSAIAVEPNTVPGGAYTFVRVVLNGPAPVGGQEVLLTSDSAYAPVPPSITVEGGRANAFFMLTTTAPPQAVIARIKARVKGVSVVGFLTITP